MRLDHLTPMINLMRVPFAINHCKHLVLSVVYLIGMKWYHIIVLILLMTNIEYLMMYLLANNVSISF